MSLRLARWLLRYWLALGRLKEPVLVVRFRILLRSLEVVELLELLRLLKFCKETFLINISFGIRHTETDKDNGIDDFMMYIKL